MIMKLQQGGLPPLVSYTPVTVTGAPEAPIASTTRDEGNSNADLTDKDLLKMLGDLDGLPSDMAVLTDALLNFYIDQQYSPFPSTSNIASRYLSALNLMKRAKFNHESYKDALDTVSKNGGINEFAITDRGLLFCMNSDGDFQLLSPEELKDNNEYRPLTNSELLYYRAHSSKLANNNELLKVVKNGIGIETVNKMVQDIVSNLGTSSVLQEGYTAKQNGKIAAGIEMLTLAARLGLIDENASNMSIDGLYKSKLLTKDLAVLAYAALGYIYRTLPENAKTLLKIKSDGTDEGLKEILTLLVTSTQNVTREFTLDLLKDMNPDGTKKSKESEESDKSKINPAIAFLIDRGVETVLPIISGTTDALTILAYLMPVTTKEGKPLGITTLDKVANESALAGLFDFSHVTMGGETMEMSSALNIAVDANSIYKAYLPVDMEKASKGITAPNLEYLGTLELVRNKIKETGATTPDELNAIYEEYGLPPFVTIDGKVNEEYYKPFGVLNATALSDAFKGHLDASMNPQIEEITNENDINNYWKIFKGKDTKEEFDNLGMWESIGLGDYQEMYKGLVYLPLKSIDPTLGAYSGGDVPSYSTLNDYRTAAQAQLRASTFENQGQLLL